MEQDIIGKKFNRLTIISYHSKDKKRNLCYICQCDCGNEKIIPIYRVKNGEIKSCGCYHKEQTSKARRRNNLLGKKFNNLLVIQRIHQNGTGRTLWFCLCSCKNTIKTTSYSLESNRIKSCGCRSRGSQTHGTIYGLYDKNDHLAYIGQTIKYNIQDRLKGHFIKCNNDRLKKWLFENEVTIKPLIENIKIENLDMMEKDLIKIIIKDYHPLLNIQHNI